MTALRIRVSLDERDGFVDRCHGSSSKRGWQRDRGGEKDQADNHADDALFKEQLGLSVPEDRKCGDPQGGGSDRKRAPPSGSGRGESYRQRARDGRDARDDMQSDDEGRQSFTSHRAPQKPRTASPIFDRIRQHRPDSDVDEPVAEDDERDQQPHPWAHETLASFRGLVAPVP